MRRSTRSSAGSRRAGRRSSASSATPSRGGSYLPLGREITASARRRPAGGHRADRPAPRSRVRAGRVRPRRGDGGGECVGLAVWPDRNVGKEMGGGAEAVDPKSLPLARHPVAAPADQARAQPRRKRRILDRLGQGKAVARIADRVGGVAAVAGVAGEQRPVAQVLAPAAAIGTDSPGPAEPGNAYSGAHAKPANALPDRRTTAGVHGSSN